MQFETNHMDIALRLLENIDYYDNASTTQLVELLGETIRSETNQNLDNVYFCPVDDSTGSSADWLLRKLRNKIGLGGRNNKKKFVRNNQLGKLTVDEKQAKIDTLQDQLNAINNLPNESQYGTDRSRIPLFQSKISELQTQGVEEPKSIVFVDDLIGSGTTFLEFLSDSGSWYNENNEYFLATIVSHQQGVEKIQNYNDNIQIISMDSIPDNEKLFHNSNQLFTVGEKAILQRYCKRVNSSKLFRYGYKNTQSNVIFYERASNNILPILYSNNNNWFPLFPR